MYDFVESMDPGLLVIGYLMDKGQWRLTASSRKHPSLLLAVFSVAVNILGLHGCHAARLCHQMKFLSCIPGAGMSVLYWWRAGRRGEHCWMQRDASKHLDLVAELGDRWIKHNVVQFMLSDDPDLDRRCWT